MSKKVWKFVVEVYQDVPAANGLELGTPAQSVIEELKENFDCTEVHANQYCATVVFERLNKHFDFALPSLMSWGKEHGLFFRLKSLSSSLDGRDGFKDKPYR
jgi:hypothetical protein